MSVLTKLSESRYNSLRKELVQKVYKSDSLTISAVAERHKISKSTLWKWCLEDLGPNQYKWLIEKSNKIRGERISKSHTQFIPIKNKPWDKKKARIAAEQAQAIPDVMKAMGISEETPNVRSIVQSAPTVKPTLPTLPTNRKLLGATVILNLDEHGKFLKYEVTGDVSVQVFTRS